MRFHLVAFHVLICDSEDILHTVIGENISEFGSQTRILYTPMHVLLIIGLLCNTVHMFAPTVFPNLVSISLMFYCYAVRKLTNGMPKCMHITFWYVSRQNVYPLNGEVSYAALTIHRRTWQLLLPAFMVATRFSTILYTFPRISRVIWG